MKRMKVVRASKRVPERKVIKASRSTSDMLEAFEDKLEEFGIGSSTQIEASSEDDELMRKQREVEIYGEDPHEKYKDVGGGFGEVGDIISVADMKKYWNNNSIGDPVLENYSDFESWFRDTKDNFLQEV